MNTTPRDTGEHTPFTFDTLGATLDAYVACALWATMDDEGNALDDSFTDYDVSAEALVSMRTDVEDFLTDNAADLHGSGLSPEQVGHGFWLNRNHYGSSFWDRVLGERGERLSAAAKAYGTSDLYVGDDGQLYIP